MLCTIMSKHIVLTWHPRFISSENSDYYILWTWVWMYICWMRMWKIANSTKYQILRSFSHNYFLLGGVVSLILFNQCMNRFRECRSCVLAISVVCQEFVPCQVETKTLISLFVIGLQHLEVREKKTWLTRWQIAWHVFLRNITL